MPSKTPKQENFMRAIAHGWKPSRMKNPPSQAVAREFVNADRKYSGGFAENRYWTGGLAAMSEINSGVPQTLNFQEGGSVGTGYLDYYGNEPQVLDLGNFKDVLKIGAMQEEGWQFDEATGTMYPPLWNIEEGGLEQTILGEAQPTTTTTAPTTTGIGTPYTAGMAWDWGGYGNYDDWRQAQIDNGTIAPEAEPAPVRDIPGAGGTPPTSSTSPPGVETPKWTPAQIAAWEAQQTAKERQSPYRDQLREHKARVASALRPGPVSVGGGTGGNMLAPQVVPPGAIGGDPLNPIYGARGGHMNYAEGGATAPRKPDVGGGAPIPGHQEGTNPHVPGTAMWRLWEGRYHIDPPPPPPAAPPPEEPGFFESLFSSETEDLKTRSQRELEAMGEARGGHVRRFQGGGLARVAAPRGGVPPWVEPMDYMEPEGYQFGGAAQGGNRLAQMQFDQRRQAGAQRGAPQNRMAQMQADYQRAQGAARGAPQMQARAQQASALGRAGGAQRWSPQQQQAWRGARGNPAARSAMSQQHRQGQALQNRPPAYGSPPQPGMAYAGGTPGFYGPGGPGRGPSIPGDVASRLGGNRFGEDMRVATGRQSYQDVVNRGGGGINPRLPGGGRMYGGDGGGGITGGARVPPNMQGFLQKQRMMNRPPSNVGGGVNRVGQQDQQGGLSRAMQRGTGRRPMSRRGGFPGRGVR